MTRVRSLIPNAAFLFLMMTTASAGGTDANLILGQKILSDDLLDAAGVERQTQLGVTVSLDFDWPVVLAIDVLSSSDDHTSDVRTDLLPVELYTEIDVMELDVGVRKFWGDRMRYYVGGGVAYVQLDARQTETGSLGSGAGYTDTIIDDDDAGVGPWINAGFVYRLGDHFNVGLDVRYSDADADLSSDEELPALTVDTGSVHYGIALGYHW